MYIPDKDRDRIEANLGDKWWRLNNLYSIIPKAGGRKITYRPNAQQKYLYEHEHNRNIILKARQLGFTTHKAIDYLDDCLFLDNQTAGLIAHTKQDAQKIFRGKVQFAYYNLPGWLKELIPTDKNENGWMVFKNGSSFYVSNSMRSAAITHLHISEFGKICAINMAKAEEIIAGALQAVEQDQFITIESTAEGPGGPFYDYCLMAMTAQRQNRRLTNMDWKFFFFPWWQNPEYKQKEWQYVTVPADMDAYFNRLQTEQSLTLSAAQRAWYVKQLETFCRGTVITQGGWDKMRQEFPSYPEEAFSRTLEGAYYATEMSAVDREGRIGKVPHNPYYRVDTWWDIGVSDSTAIWFTQTIGRKIHVIDYYENQNQGLPHYAQMLDAKQRDNGYRYGKHTAPHDIRVREWTHGETRLEMAAQHGIPFKMAERGPLADGIEQTRRTLYYCWFDASKCAEGVNSLRTYTRKRDDKTGDWEDKPRKGKQNHGADAFRTMAVMHNFDSDTSSGLAPVTTPIPAAAWT
jgi:hypothetical protein